MVKRSIINTIKFLKDKLSESGLLIENIAIFGSSPKGNYINQSDLDLIIISGDFIGKDIFERSEMTMDSEIQTLRKFMIPMDILKKTPDEYENSIAAKRFETERV